MRRLGPRANFTKEEKQEFARTLRKNMPLAERMLWPYLRRCKIQGLKFRRQSLVLGWIADFYCPSIKLVIELDGPFHVHSKDRFRDSTMCKEGITVLRFPNEDVFRDLRGVLSKIRLTCRSLV